MRLLLILGCAVAALFMAGCGSCDNDSSIKATGVMEVPHSVYRDDQYSLAYTVSRTVKVADIDKAKQELENIIQDNNGFYISYTQDTICFKIGTEQTASAIAAIENLGKVTGRGLETSDEASRRAALLYSIISSDREYNFLVATIRDKKLLAQVDEVRELLDSAENNSNISISYGQLINKLRGVTVQVTFAAAE